MPRVWCLLSLFPLIGSKGHRKHNDVQRPLIRCDKHNHIKNAQKSWEVQIFGAHGLRNLGLAKKERDHQKRSKSSICGSMDLCTWM